MILNLEFYIKIWFCGKTVPFYDFQPNVLNILWWVHEAYRQLLLELRICRFATHSAVNKLINMSIADQ